MKTSEQINELAAALAAAQLEMNAPKFDSENPYFKSRYASLGEVRAAVLPALNKHGLAVIQGPISLDGSAGCTWMLMHSSGQWNSGELILPVADVKDKPGVKTCHGYAAAISYARRVTLQAIACVAAEDDDDGNAAVESAGKPKAAPKPRAIKARESVESEDKPLPGDPLGMEEDYDKSPPVCPENEKHGAMNFKPAGVVKATGRAYGAFWSCKEYPKCRATWRPPHREQQFGERDASDAAFERTPGQEG